MKFLADENIDKLIVEHLRKVGYKVLYVLEMSPSISDDEIIQLANEEKALLLTADKDFGELVFRQRKFTYGVILIRLFGLSSQQKASIVSVVIQEHLNELAMNFTVITRDNVRIRKL